MNPDLKQITHKLTVKSSQPGLWLRWFFSPVNSRYGKGTIVGRNSRLDISPFNKFLIDANSIIHDYCTINNSDGDVVIGDDSHIGIGSVIIGPVTIGNHVITARNVVLCGSSHMCADLAMPAPSQTVIPVPITIEDDAWIGANAVIAAGVTIGRHSVIAGGSVVTKNIPPYSFASGNPAKLIKRYDLEKKEWVKF